MMLISEETVVLALPKFMQTLDDTIYRELEKIAKRRGISIQELIRAVIVPEWVTGHDGTGAKEAAPTKLNAWR
jgi:Ribbon-helix-helix protein, copG family